MKFEKALTLTALATGITTGTFGFVTSSAQAISLGGFRYPQSLGIKFELTDTNDDQGAIQNFAIIDSDNEILAKSSKSLKLNPAKSIDELPDNISFNNIEIQNDNSSEFVDIIPEGQIYQFSFVVNNLMLINDDNTEKEALENSEGGTVNFFVPSKFTFEGESFDLFADSNSSLPPDENNLIQILTVPAGSSIDKIPFPTIFNNFLEPNDASRFIAPIVFDTQPASISESVPEADTLASILILGGLSGIVGWKRKFQ